MTVPGLSATDVIGTATTDQPTIVYTPLPRSEEFIIYSKYNIADDRYEVWAINPNRPSPLLVTSDPDLYPRSWSPSNEQWLFTHNGSIYIINYVAPDIRTIYNNREYKSVYPFWLSEEIVLFNAFRDTLMPPDMYSVNINSGVVTQLFPGSSYYIQDTFRSEMVWLRADWRSKSLEAVNQNGKTEKFFDDFLVRGDPFDSDQIQRIDKLDSYVFVAKREGDANFKVWLGSNHVMPQVLFDPGDGGVDEFAVSPDEQYVALTYVTSENVYVYVFNLDDFQLAYKWIYPYKLGSGLFTWSPDSQSIALLYSDAGSSTGITSGIQVMNIKTGETKIILKEDVIEIIDWHLIK